MTPDLPPPFDAAWFRFVIGFTLGAVLGSFTTMLAYRLPRGLSIIAPRSHCPACRTTLGRRDLVPLLSWLSSRGRCRHCGGKIGNRYFWIEFASSLSGGVACVLIGFSPLLLLAYIGIIGGVLTGTWALSRNKK